MRVLKSVLDRSGSTGAPVSLLMVDIDHFKRVNDGYGHLVGDEVLKTVSRCLGSEARVGDKVARFDG